MSHRESESDDHQDDRFSESKRGGSSGDGDASEEDEGRTAWKNIQFADISVGEQIGGGGFAIVYKGTYRNKNVALKTMFDPRVDETLRADFMQELQILSELDHPGIVRMFGACVTPPNLCMVLELCHTSLYALLHNTTQPVSEKQIITMALETAEALEYLHSQSPPVIHRDIKTQNLLLTSRGQIRLCDFGLVSAQSTMAGTPAYMAPELLKGSPFSRKVDTYAFGVVLWEIIMRAVPFHAWEASEVRDFVLRGDRLDLPRSGCHKACIQLIERCWAAEQTVRPEFSKIAKALARIKASVKDVSHIDDATSSLGDSFDALSTSVHRTRNATSPSKDRKK